MAHHGVPRVCGDDPGLGVKRGIPGGVFPAYAGMIPRGPRNRRRNRRCSPRMRG